MRTIVRIAGLLVALIARLSAADSAVIIDSGSTNTAGFEIEVSPSGEAVYTPKPRRANQLHDGPATVVTRQIPAGVVQRLFDDLKPEESLAALPSQGCMKSASFGTRMVIEYRAQRTPDLRCGDHGNARMKALIQDCADVIKVFSGK